MNYLKYLFLALTIGYFQAQAQNLVTYPLPKSNFELQSSLYKVIVTQGKTVRTSFVYVSKASTAAPAWEWAKQENKTFHYTTFSFKGSVQVQVIKYNSTASYVELLPALKEYGPIKTTENNQDKKVSFTILKAGKYSVEFDDDKTHQNALMIFADDLELSANVPAPNTQQILYPDTSTKEMPLKISPDQHIIFFRPGVYNVGLLNVPPQITQVYFSGGAFVRGYILAERDKCAPLKINGRGVLSSDAWPFHYPVLNDTHNVVSRDWYKSLRIDGGKKNIIEGITIVDGSAFNIVLHADSSTVDNVNIHGFRYNNDGITIGGSHNLIENCFMHLSDDAITLQDIQSITIKNCIFWQLSGSCIQLGWYPHSIGGQNVINNCHIIHAEWPANLSQNAGFIDGVNHSKPTPNSKVENFTVSDIFFDTEVTRIIDIRMERPNTKQPNQFANFYFSNIRAKIPLAYNDPTVYLNGYDDQHMISNFHFENFYINNVLIGQNNYADKGYFLIGNYTEKIEFK